MLYIFNKDEVLLEIIDNFYDDEYKRVLNKDYTYTFKIDVKDSSNIKRKNKVGFYDEDDIFQLFTIEEIESNYFNEDAVDVFCQHDFYSLNDKIIEDKRIVDGTCKEALTKALEGTNYKVGEVAELHTATLNYYFISSLKALNEIVSTYGGELDFRLELNEDKTEIANRYVDIKHRLGSDTGVRFTYDTNVKEVIRTEVMDNHYTVLYGRGSSLETEGGGNTRLITFEDVEWTTPGKPANKPLGNKYIEHVEGIAKWGRIEGIYENKDIKEPSELLDVTWEKLKETKDPQVSYKVTVDDLAGVVGYEHLKTDLGDTIIVLDDDYDVDFESRIVEERYSIKDISATKEITLGYILPSMSDGNGSGGGTITGGGSTGGGGDKPEIDNGSFPSTLPDIPVVTTKGRFATIEISWTYENKMYYNYEVYASQLENFNPTPDNMIFKGQSSVFLHEVKPKQTWYYRVRAGNTHGKYTEFSIQGAESTTKIVDGAEYFENAAINSALIRSLNADVIDAGTVKGTYIDARNLSVTDGNGKRTLDIDSFGNVDLDVNNLSIRSKDIEGELAINMIPNSNFATDDKVQGWHFWQSDYSANGCSWYKDQHGGFLTGEGLGISSHLNQLCTATSEQVFVEYGEYYTLSIDKLNVERNVTNSRVMIRCLAQDNTIVKELTWNYGVGNHRDIVHTIQIDDDRIKKVSILIWNDGATVSNKEYVVVFFNRLQFQKGKIRTPWKLATTDSLIQNIADMRVDAEGIRNKVATIEGDYVTGTQFTQTNDQFRYEFLNSGADNELWNSDLSQGQRGWTLDGGDRVSIEINIGYSGNGIPVNSGIRIGDCTNAYAFAMQVIKPKRPNANKYRVGCWVHMDNVNNTHGSGSSMADIYFQIRYKDGTNGWPSFDLRDFVSNNSGWQWVDFELLLEGKAVEQIEFFVYKRSTTGTLRVTQIYFREGDVPSKKWKSHPGEVHSNTTLVDGQGVEISHNNGSKSRMTHDCAEYTHSNGHKVLRIKDGGLNFFTWDTPEMVGFIKPAALSNRIHNGVSLSTYASGDFIVIGHSDSSDENNWATTPYITLCKHDLPYPGYLQGVNINKRSLIWDRMYIKHSMDVDVLKPIEFYGESGNMNQIYGSGGGVLNVMGDNRINLGHRAGGATALIMECMPGWQNNSRIRLQSEFDFQSYKVHNFRASYNLEPKSLQGKVRMKREDKTLHTSYTTNQEEIRHSGKSTTFGNSAIIELPINIAENINNDYIVHLTKYGRGDIWIKEVNPYYFEVESDVGSIGFSYEVVATKLEEREIDSRMRIDYETNTESPKEIEPPDATFEDLTEIKEEYWKLYRK